MNNWRCSYCGDRPPPSRETAGESRPIIIRLKRVVKAPEYEPGGCVVCRLQDFSVAKFDDPTVIICDQCEKEYHVGCLREIGLCDLKELPKDKWFCCHDCNKIHEGLPNFILGGPDHILTPISNIIYQKQAERGLCHELGNDMYWQILVATSRGNQGKGYFQALFAYTERLLFSMNVTNLVLPAAEEAESIWTKKLGFRKISNERLATAKNSPC